MTKKIPLVLYLGVSFIFLTSCDFFLGFIQKPKYRKVSIGTSHDHVQIPRLFLDVLSQKYVEYIQKTGQKTNLTDDEIIINIPRSPFNVNLRLREKTKGVLKFNSIIHFPKGGGIIDLASFVTEKEGSFYVQFDIFKKSINKVEKEVFRNFMLFYSSHTKKVHFGGSAPGTSCGKLLDLTSYAYKFLRGKGLHIKTRGSGDSSPIQYLGGSFYFVYFKNKDLHLGAIKFIDSRFPHLQC